MIEWAYLNLKRGRLVDDDGIEYNTSFPSFATREEADEYLENNDLRASLR